MGMKGERMNTVTQISERKKRTGQSYKKELLKKLAKKATGSDLSVQQTDKLSQIETNVSQSCGTNEDATVSADSSTSCSQPERLDFLLRRVRDPPVHAQINNSSDHVAQTKLQEKNNLSESKSNLDISSPKEKLAYSVAYECKYTEVNFVEHWVPVMLSNVQMEQYCGCLFSNQRLLCSSKIDSAETLHDVLISSRKCCDHPYLVDRSLRTSLIQGIPEPEQLDAEIKLSSKLLFLHKILLEIKRRGLRVLILYQSLSSGMITNGEESLLSGLITNGDILDDIIHHKFGEDSYVRIVGEISPSKKRSLLNTFNDRRNAKFVCLMETRSCVSSIKLASIDTVVFFNSDWDPTNDLRALQRLKISSQFEQVKVFRLYSPHTLEEKGLILAKQSVDLESNVMNMKQSTCRGLLSWGASYLFKMLDVLNTAQDTDSEMESSLEDVFLELYSILSNMDSHDSANRSFIVEAARVEGRYSSNISLLGETESSLLEKFSLLEGTINNDRPYLFWTNLFDGRNPSWRYISNSSPRNRKPVKHFCDLAEEYETASKRCRQEVESTVCQDPPICRRRMMKKFHSKDRKGKSTGSRKYRQWGKKVNYISLGSDRRQRMVSWLYRQSKAATLPRGQTPMVDSSYSPSHQCLSPRGTVGPSPPTQATIQPPFENPVRLTENSGNDPSPEASRATPLETLQSVCSALQMELEKLQKEKNQKLKLHEDMKLQAKMECEKEIDEIRKKYDMLLRNAEMAFAEESEVLEARFKKVSINKTLAEALMLGDKSTNETVPQEATTSVMEEKYLRFLHLTRSTTATRPDEVAGNRLITSSQPTAPASVNSRAGCEVRAPAPHFRHMRPPLPITKPKLTSSREGVVFSPVSFHLQHGLFNLHDLQPPLPPCENYIP